MSVLKFKDENGIEMIYYPMSKGDEFTVVIKNTNTTIASILFNAKDDDLSIKHEGEGRKGAGET